MKTSENLIKGGLLFLSGINPIKEYNVDIVVKESKIIADKHYESIRRFLKLENEKFNSKI